jgi:diguanylate cyclase (GGDEF)-like protein/PAS domain S-box-containing protein
MISLVKPRSEMKPEPLVQQLLIVDDEPLIRSGLRYHLEGEGRIVLECGTGTEAVALLKKEDIELVLLDINLPDISGLEILEWIRANRKPTGVILVSGDDCINSAIKALRQGAAEFVRKPYDVDDLTHKVKAVLHHRQLERNSVLMAARLEQSERLHRFMVESSPDIIYTLDKAGCFTFVNGRIETLLGYSKDELVGSPYFTIVHDDDRERAVFAFNERRSDHRATTNLEIRLKCKKEGNHRIFEDRQVITMLSAVGIYEGQPGSGEVAEQAKRYLGTYGVARDITERKLAEETINFQALHDHLTHLPNRRLFRDRLELAIIQAKRSGVGLAVMFIDLDRFKLVNDTHGHAEGDELLRNVALRLRNCIRGGDTLARQGGDEFTALLTELHSEADATVIANKIVADFKTPYIVAGDEFRATASIGIAIYPGDGESADTLISNADIAMYKVKGNGKNGFQLYSPAINAGYQERLILENELRQALRNDEFELYFQPQVNVSSRRIVGLEALLRWRHPVHGLLNPGGFIELAEETGLIVSITDWVLIEACTCMAGWRASGFKDLRLAVNFSPSEFERDDVVERICTQIDRYGIPAENFEIEITENMLLSETVGVVEKMRQLRNRGIRIAIDDFGTRYSSLNYLRSLPVSAIKIDQSFVRDLSGKQGTSPIISAIVGIAQGFGLHLLAEGVESEEQLNILSSLGCEEMQGYLFSRPVPAGEIKDILTGMAWCPAQLLQVESQANLFANEFVLEETG